MNQRVRAAVCEFAGTAIMMAIGVTAMTLLWAPDSPVPHIASERLRLLATGSIFATGATLVVYSPLGRVSGAHLNPAVTLGFWQLHRIATADAVAYAIMQTLGAIAGVFVVSVAFGAMGASIGLGETRPGPGVTTQAAIGYETAITFLLMFLLLTCLNRPRVAPFTGVIAGSLVVLLVTFEAPLTGTSLNPARSLAPALLMRRLDVLGIYFIGPSAGALLAVWLWRGRSRARQSLICAKLYHGGPSPCHLPGCPYVAFAARDTIVQEGDAAGDAYVIESGQVEVARTGADGRRAALARLGRGDWFGEMSVLLGEPRTATVVAVTDVRARRVTREAFEQAMADDPARAIGVMRQLAARLRDADRLLH